VVFTGDVSAPLHLPVTYNFRAVEGTRSGSLYRSDALSRLNDEGRARLRELGVRRVIDLRAGLDGVRGGDGHLAGVGAEVVRVPILDGGRLSQMAGITIDVMYRHILDDHLAEVGRVVTAVAEAPDGAVVIHCTAGKDRTGLTSALIQLAVGVAGETVIADYAATEQHLAGEWADGMVHRVRERGVELTPGLQEVLVASPAVAMQRALEHLETAYGGAGGYLAAAGVGASVVERLRTRLLADPA